MPATAVTSPGSAASTELGGVNWLNPSNALTSNDTYATALGVGAQDLSDGLDLTNFGFSLPANQLVTGIEATVEGMNAGLCLVHTVQLLSGGGVVGDNKSGSEEFFGEDSVFPFGGAADNWGTALTTAIVNDSSFGIRIRMTLYDAGAQAMIDHVTLKLTYSDAPAAPAGSGLSGLSGLTGISGIV